MKDRKLVVLNYSDLTKEQQKDTVYIDLQKHDVELLDFFIQEIKNSIPYDICDGNEALEYVNEAAFALKAQIIGGKKMALSSGSNTKINLFNIEGAENVVAKLVYSFPNCQVLTDRNPIEFVADKKTNTYFILGDCKDKLDVDCKVLEWLSRAACKSEPYDSYLANEKFHKAMLSGINNYLGTNFTEGDMMIIYSHLGNACNHEKTKEFVESGFKLSIIDERLAKYENDDMER